MKTYVVRFVGRPIGAIGVLWEQETTVRGDTREAAEARVWDRFEHVSILECREVKLSKTENKR